jgi:hypothetical protein
MITSPADITVPGRALGRCLIAAAAAFLVLVTLMAVVTALGAPHGDSVVAQIADLARDDTTYRLGFFVASLLPAAMVPFMAVVALGVAAPIQGEGLTEARLCGWAGIALVAAYAPLSAAAYASQYTVFEWLVRRDLVAAAPWYFNNAHGAPYTFDLLAYAIWGLGAAIVAWPLLRRRGALRWMSWTLAASGLLSMAAFGLHALESSLASPATLTSAVLTVPFALGAIAYGWGLLRRPALLRRGSA